MAKRDYPNDYFAWYNDDKRVAILAEDTTGISNERTKERYDTYQDADITNGLRITYHSKYETITTSNFTGELSTTNGLDTGMQVSLLCYVKSRIHEDRGEFEQARYFRTMYERELKQYPSRKSGVRALSVPNI